MIKVEKGTVTLTEQTVRELVIAIGKAKNEIEFTDKPMPDGEDMALESYVKMRKERGIILVGSEYSGLTFEIHLEKAPRTQESLGYRLK